MNSITINYGNDTSTIFLYIKYNNGKYRWSMPFKKQENGDYKTDRQLFDNLVIDYLNESGYAFSINIEPKINYLYKMDLHKCEFQLTPRALLVVGSDMSYQITANKFWIDDITIKQKINGNIYIQVPHLKKNLYGYLLYTNNTNNTYKTSFVYRQNDIIEYLIENNFIKVLNQEFYNNNFNKYIFRLTTKSLLRLI